jgi:hypothetical protein
MFFQVSSIKIQIPNNSNQNQIIFIYLLLTLRSSNFFLSMSSSKPWLSNSRTLLLYATGTC